ncbi:MAG TPA: zinc dependent phospholipase C family protein [Bryobacterales bacterium]|nr:zinc dependent phospholipase C family protein [Bryobacterales bacterium]
MRRLAFPLLVAFLALPCLAWHTPVHQHITEAAWESLPAALRGKLAAEEKNLIERYCLYPDDYRNAGAAEREKMRVYCERPDGQPIHNVTWQRSDDLASLAYTLNGMIRATRAGDTRAAAQHAGVLAHFLEDSTCPAHSLYPMDSPLELMKDLLPPPASKRDIQLHTVIETSAPAFDLASRAPQSAGSSVAEAAQNLLDRAYRAIRHNRAGLIELVRAAYADDEATMNRFRLEAARTGGGLLADACYTSLRLAEQGP